MEFSFTIRDFIVSLVLVLSFFAITQPIDIHYTLKRTANAGDINSHSQPIKYNFMKLILFFLLFLFYYRNYVVKYKRNICIIRPRRMHRIDAAYCYRCRTFRGLCVCVFVLGVAKADEPIEMFWDRLTWAQQTMY